MADEGRALRVSIRVRSALVVAVAIVVASAAMTVPIRQAYLSGFEELEQEDAAEDLDRTRGAIAAAAATVAVHARDYATWDETYAFAGGEMPNYGEYNLVLPTFAGLGVSAVTIADNSGKTLFSGAVDDGAKNFRAVPAALKTLSAANGLLLPTDALDGRSGVVDGGDAVYLVATYPIMPSDRTGASRGTLMMARALDVPEMARIAAQTRLPMQIIRPPVAGDDGVSVRDDAELRLSWQLRDLAGAPIATVQTDLPRAIHARGLAGAWWLGAVVVSLGLGFGALVLVLLEWLVLRRLARLSADVERVARRGDHTLRVGEDGGDEIGDLGREINRMLGSLDEMAGLLGNARRLLREAFGRYLSEEVAAAVLANPDGLDLRGEQRELTILFSDIRSYTVIGEALPPHEVVTLLNEYFGAMSAEIEREGGTIIEFLGDAILAVFNAPNHVDDHEARAVRAAIAMRAATDVLNDAWATSGRSAAWVARGVPSLSSRIGLHRGRVVAGNLGSRRRMKYAVIGDAVNTASRIENLNERVGTDILMSAAVYAGLPPELAGRCVDRGVHKLKGREAEVQVYSVS
jgi:adenylate cyclase